jgi:hypothetical protein
MTFQAPFALGKHTGNNGKVPYFTYATNPINLAIDFKNFCILLFVPVMKNLLHDKYFDHFNKFVKAMCLLDSRSITPEELDIAEQLLKEFEYGKWKSYALIVNTIPQRLRLFTGNSIKLSMYT